MNLLSHYYIDRHHADVNYKFGLVFPDLFRGFNKHLRASLVATPPASSFEQVFVAGIQRHYLVDKIFHNLPFFHQWDVLLKNELLTHTDLRQRVFFLSHIYLEMLIDRLLIQENTELLASFYGDLRKVQLTDLDIYLGRLGKQEYASDFFGKFSLFIEARYLYRYSNHESFVLALLSTYKKVCRVEFNQHHIRAVMEITARIEQQHGKELLSVFDTMGNALISPHEK